MINLSFVFAGLFFVFYVQPLIVFELILEEPLPRWVQVQTLPSEHGGAYFLLAYLALFLVSFTVFARDRTAVRRSRFPSRRRLFSAGLLALGIVSGLFLFYIWDTGGLQSFLTDHRQAVYADQWERTEESSFQRYTRIALGMAFTAAAVVGGYMAGTDTQTKGPKRLVYLGLALPATFIRMAMFSRGFFMPLALFFLARLVVGTRTKYFWPQVLVLLALVILGVYLGISLRGGNGADEVSLDVAAAQLSNSMNGLSTFLDSQTLDRVAADEGFFLALAQLSPVPSFLIQAEYESNLTTLILDRTSGSSTPMPFLGEAYYLMGWWGLCIALLQGAVAGVINKQVAREGQKDRIWWLLLYLACILSFLYMPHSGMRACTRMIVWVFTLFLFVKVFKAFTWSPKFKSTVRR